MPNTSLVIDKEIRDLAAKRAKIDRISLSAITRLLLRDYAEGKISVWSTMTPRETYRSEMIAVDPSLQHSMDSISALWHKKKTSWK